MRRESLSLRPPEIATSLQDGALVALVLFFFTRGAVSPYWRRLASSPPHAFRKVDALRIFVGAVLLAMVTPGRFPRCRAAKNGCENDMYADYLRTRRVGSDRIGSALACLLFQR